MSVHASRIRVQQHGDAVIGERTDVEYDERTNLLTENRTTVAEVPIEGGGTAVLRYTAVQTSAMPQRNNHGQDQRMSRFPHAQRRHHDRGLPPQRPKPKPMPSGCVVFPLCGCIVCLASVAIAVSTVASGVLHCEPHYIYIHALLSIILASLACCMACLCCTCTLQPDLERNLPFYMIGCCCVSVVFVLFTAAVVVDGLYIYGDNSKKLFNDSKPAVNETCKYMSIQSFGVSIASYVLVVVFVLFFCVVAIECLRSLCSNCYRK